MVRTGQQEQLSCPRRGLTATRSLPLPSLRPPLQVCLWFGDELTQLREMKKSLSSFGGPHPALLAPKAAIPVQGTSSPEHPFKHQSDSCELVMGGPAQGEAARRRPAPPTLCAWGFPKYNHWSLALEVGGWPLVPNQAPENPSEHPPRTPQPGRKRDLLFHLLHTQSTPRQGRLRGSTLCKMPAKLLPSDQPSNRGHLGARGSPAQLQ